MENPRLEVGRGLTSVDMLAKKIAQGKARIAVRSPMQTGPWAGYADKGTAWSLSTRHPLVELDRWQTGFADHNDEFFRRWLLPATLKNFGRKS